MPYDSNALRLDDQEFIHGWGFKASLSAESGCPTRCCLWLQARADRCGVAPFQCELAVCPFHTFSVNCLGQPQHLETIVQAFMPGGQTGPGAPCNDPALRASEQIAYSFCHLNFALDPTSLHSRHNHKLLSHYCLTESLCIGC